MKRLSPLALLALLVVSGCGPTDTPSTKLEAPPATLEEKVKNIEKQANLSEEQKASAIAILRQQEQPKNPAERPPTSK